MFPLLIFSRTYANKRNVYINIPCLVSYEHTHKEHEFFFFNLKQNTRHNLSRSNSQFHYSYENAYYLIVNFEKEKKITKNAYQKTIFTFTNSINQKILKIIGSFVVLLFTPERHFVQYTGCASADYRPDPIYPKILPLAEYDSRTQRSRGIHAASRHGYSCHVGNSDGQPDSQRCPTLRVGPLRVCDRVDNQKEEERDYRLHEDALAFAHFFAQPRGA